MRSAGVSTMHGYKHEVLKLKNAIDSFFALCASLSLVTRHVTFTYVYFLCKHHVRIDTFFDGIKIFYSKSAFSI